MKQVLCIAAFLCAAQIIFTGSAKAQTHVQTPRRPSGVLPYLEYLPPGYEASGELFPAIIFLHGSGEKGDGSDSQIWRVAKNGPPKLIEQGDKMCFTVNGEEKCFIVISPQTYADWQIHWVNNLANYVLENYKVDPTQLYLTGLSLGGYGTYAGSGGDQNNPNKFAAIAPVAAKALCPHAENVGRMNIPVWEFHGDADTAIPLSEALKAIECVKQGNPTIEPILTIYPGVGHNSWDNAYRTDHAVHNPNVYEWMLSYHLEQGSVNPSVELGPTRNIQLPVNSINLSGSVSSANPISSYQWTKSSGPAATLTNQNTSTLTVTNMVAGTYVFRLTVTDNAGLSGSDEVSVVVVPEPVNQAPVANAGNDQTIGLPTNSTVFTGSGSDDDGRIVSYQWTKVSGPSATMQNQNTATLSVSNLIAGDYVFRLTVTDDDGATGSDNVNLTVEAENVPPVSVPGPARTILLPTNSVNLDGSRSYDPDGEITRYRWVQIQGPDCTLGNTDGPILSVTNMEEGFYTFGLTVTDNDYWSNYNAVNVSVEQGNQPPTANAGNDITIKLPFNTASVQGQGTDIDGEVVSYQWVKVSGPSVTIGNQTVATLQLSNLVEGTYVFGFTVTDDDGASDYDEMTLTVNHANLPPVANAGADQSINIDESSLVLTGSGSDSDGTITSYLWEKRNGPSVVMANTTNPNMTLSNYEEGTYVFSLTVTDNEGATDDDEVTVIVINTNEPPVVSAGGDQSLQLPLSSTILNGSVTDVDGTIVSRQWVQISGPSNATLVNANTSTLTVSSLIQGEYIFGFTAVDNDGASGYDEARITVDQANQPPSVNAGSDIDVKLPSNLVNITAIASDPDGSISSYSWIKTSGPPAQLQNVNTSTLTAGGLIEGTYIFTIEVTDNEGATATDNVTVTVSAANQPPIANAGANTSITLPTNTVTLNGGGTDNDGSITGYQWVKVSGGNATLVNASTSTLTANSLVAGTYVFGLTVADDEGATGYDEVSVIVYPEPVNQLPVVNAGNDVTIRLPVNTATFNGNAYDPDGTVETYEWTLIQGPGITMPANTSSSSLTVNNLVAGNYIFRLTVTDNDGGSSYDQVTLTVNEEIINQAPQVNAGTDIYIQLPINSATINATATDDGVINNYSWQQITGPGTATITNGNQEDATVSNLVEGIYEFRLTVTDNNGATGSDQVRVLVSPVNQPPQVNAGPDHTIDLPQTTLSITAGVTDPDGTIDNVIWTKRSGPSGGALTDDDQFTVHISALGEGVYVFRITATDNQGATSYDEVRVTVQAQNQYPVVNAGTDVSIQLPTNTLNLSGSANDSDGTISNISWTKEDGPAATMTNASTLTLTLTDLLEGQYRFRLTVTDNDGATTYDDVIVLVEPEEVNQPPVANAGVDKSVTLPTNTTNIFGSGTDTDGSIASYFWERISGPSASLSNIYTSTLTVGSLLEGQYIFQLTVTDNDGSTDSDQMTLIVNPAAINQAPVANAGRDISLTLPNNSVNVVGSGSDPDGTVVSYAWSKVTGPNVTMTNTTNAVLSLSDMVEGSYTFRLVVTDDDGATDSDEVVVVINPENINQAPIANAGENINITLPTNSVNISGSGTDNDGDIVSYSWIKVSGPAVTLNNTGSATLSATQMVEGSYLFRLTVTDDDGATGSDEVRINVFAEVINQPPTANAGNDITITLPVNSTVIQGTASDPDGTIGLYAWSKVSGPMATLQDQNTDRLTVQNMVEGTYVFRLMVMDTDGASASDEVRVHVLAEEVNQAPTANAGSDKIVNLPTNSVVLNGSGNDDDGEIVTYQWIKISGPVAVLSNENTATLSVSGMTEGKYEFRLTVTDDDDARATDNVIVTVIPATTNQNPVVNAGNDKTIYLPTNTSNMQAEANDPDGNISSYLWEKRWGPSLTMLNENTSMLTVQDLEEGVYLFRVTVTDNQNASSYDEVRLTVSAANVNQPPTANAGEDVLLTLPTDQVNLSGSGNDPDGSITSFSWMKVSGPAVTMTNATSKTVALSDLQAGTYSFRLTVTDDDGASGQDYVSVVVNSADINRNPVANAGKDKEIILPNNSVVLIGTGSDPDGSIVSRRWEQIIGPDVTAEGINTNQLKLSDLVEGVYQFMYVVTDDDNASGSDFVIINVLPEGTNIRPIANAGVDKIVYLPYVSLDIIGTGYDSDGHVVHVEWSKESGPAVTMTENDGILTLTDLEEGLYRFKFVVQDNEGGISEDEMLLTVMPSNINRSPVANAGPDISITLPENQVTLTAQYEDPDGDDVTLMWMQISGPVVTLSDPTAASQQLTDLVEGIYRFHLKVTDSEDAYSIDQVNIFVAPEPPENIPPEANAGEEDLYLYHPVNNYKYIGTGSDPDGLIVRYQWNMISGPTFIGEPVISDTLTLNQLEVGDYLFELVVMDDDSATAYSELIIHVMPGGGGASEAFGIPKFFSPGDGNLIGDTWEIERVDLLHGCRMMVYNRYGVKVYETDNFDIQWDGRMNGEYLPEGDYYYVIQCSDQTKTYSGGVRILRAR